MNIQPDEWLTVAAHRGREPLGPSEIVNSATLVLRIKGSDLALYEARSQRARTKCASASKCGSSDLQSRACLAAVSPARLCCSWRSLASAASCNRSVDIKEAIEVVDASGGWYDAGIVEGKNKIVPSVTFKLQEEAGRRPVRHRPQRRLPVRAGARQQRRGTLGGLLRSARRVQERKRDRPAGGEASEWLYRRASTEPARDAEEQSVPRRPRTHLRQASSSQWVEIGAVDVQRQLLVRKLSARSSSAWSLPRADSPCRHPLTVLRSSAGWARSMPRRSSSPTSSAAASSSSARHRGQHARDVVFLSTWVAGGLLAFCGAMAYAELAALRPRAGGEYVYLREATAASPDS